MTHRRDFGEWDWIEARTESHHDFAMFTVAGNGMARQCYNDMPPFVSFAQAVEFIESYLK